MEYRCGMDRKIVLSAILAVVLGASSVGLYLQYQALQEKDAYIESLLAVRTSAEGLELGFEVDYWGRRLIMSFRNDGDLPSSIERVELNILAEGGYAISGSLSDIYVPVGTEVFREVLTGFSALGTKIDALAPQHGGEVSINVEGFFTYLLDETQKEVPFSLHGYVYPYTELQLEEGQWRYASKPSDYAPTGASVQAYTTIVNPARNAEVTSEVSIEIYQDYWKDRGQQYAEAIGSWEVGPLQPGASQAVWLDFQLLGWEEEYVFKVYINGVLVWESPSLHATRE